MSDELHTDTQKRALLGFIEYAKLNIFLRLARDSSNAPRAKDQLDLARLSATAFASLKEIETLVIAAGADPAEVISPFFLNLTEVEARIHPVDWWERLVKSYAIIGLLADLQALGAELLSPDMQAKLLPAIDNSDFLEFTVQMLSPILGAEPALSSRLGLWGRRVYGDVLAAIVQMLKADKHLQGIFAMDESRLAVLQEKHSKRFEVLGIRS